MNKDIYYIEPEDDITDIINHLKSSKQKVVALVPPKKLSVMRSAINLKLIAKTAKNLDKAVVIVTIDPILMKLAATSGLPFSKNLQTRPILPSEYKDAPVITKTPVKASPISEIDDSESSDQTEELGSKQTNLTNSKKTEKTAFINNPTDSKNPQKSQKEVVENLDSTELDQDSEDLEEDKKKENQKNPKFRFYAQVDYFRHCTIYCSSGWWCMGFCFCASRQNYG